MEEWKNCYIGDVCSTISETYKANSSEVVLVNTSDVLEGKCLNHIKVDNKDLKGQFKKAFHQNDILYSEIRPANKRFAFIDFEPTDYIASTKLMVIRNNESILPEYLFYILQSKTVIEELQMLAESRSGTFPQITFSEVSRMQIKLPNTEEQIKILGVLKSLDKKIELNRRINDNLEQQIQVIFNHYFTNEPYDCLLGDVVKTTSGGTPSRKIEDIYYNGSIPWVKSKELNGTFLFDTEEHITELGVNNSSAKLLPKNSVLIAMYGATVGEYAIISKTMCCNQAVCALIPNDKIPYSYLLMIAKNRKYELINMAVGSAQQNISQVLVKNLPISSNYEIIANFNNATMSIFKEIKNNSSEIVKLMSIRDLLLPKLMSGELKINEMNN